MRLRQWAALAAVSYLFMTVPATAGPLDPVSGCVGLPTVPEAFVCLDVNPSAAPPTVGSGDETLLTIPAVCFFLGCTDAVAVNAPTVGPSGYFAVVYYNGWTYVVAVSVPYVPGVAALTLLQVGRQLCGSGGGEETYTSGWFACSGGDPTTRTLANAVYDAGRVASMAPWPVG